MGWTARMLLMGVSLALLVVQVAPQDSCQGYRGRPGVPGIPGAHGLDGVDGSKGERGDPGEAGQSMMGQKGDKGLQGPPGRSGLKGDMGLQGPPGPIGPAGPKGQASSGTIQRQKSFFSYKIGSVQPPPINKPINFNRVVLAGLNSTKAGDQLDSGVFTSTIKGVYFFTYHISGKDKVCPILKQGTETKLSTCDTSDTFLLTAGSVVLQLDVGEQVSLEHAAFSNIINNPNRIDNSFTGFLLYPTR